MARTTDELEVEARQHRAGVVNALGGLFDALNPERIGRETVEQVSGAGREAVEAAMAGARRNPAGLALIGIGAARVMASARKTDEHPQLQPARDAMPGQTERMDLASAHMSRRTRIGTGRLASGEYSSSKMRQMLDTGLDKLGPDARKRVMDARLAALDAQEKVEHQARIAKRKVTEAHQSQPFTTGLAVAGIGALIGALLPSTRVEREMVGAKRDQMIRQAEAVMRAEIAELEARGKAAVSASVESAKQELKAG